MTSDIENTQECPCSLLPRPFCGGAASEGCHDPGAPYPGGGYYVACENEDCLMDEVSVMKKAMVKDEAEAVAWVRSRWNRRSKGTTMSADLPSPVLSAGARGSAFDRWTAGDGDEDTKRMAWDAGRAPLLAVLREIHEIATRHKRASDLKRYLLADLESIERHSSPNA